MYPEGEGTGSTAGSSPPTDYGADYGMYDTGGWKEKILGNFEGFIPLILIVIIGLFLLTRLNIIGPATPLIGPLVGSVLGGHEPIQMLIIGSPSQDILAILQENRESIRYVIKTAENLERNPDEQLAQYQLILFDQSNQSKKEVSKQLGLAIQDYVRKGGKMIIIKDSGIRRPRTYDVIGWEATFGETIPVSCARTINNQPSCTQPVTIVGRVKTYARNHPILKGIDTAPAENQDALILSILDTSKKGTELAYIEDAGSRTSYVGIVESKSIIGKVIYFNYDPGKTRGIFENTLRYLGAR